MPKKDTYVLTGKHRTADGKLLSTGDEIKLTPVQAQALVGKVELLAAKEAADNAANQSADERIADLTAQVDKLVADNKKLKSRLAEYEDDDSADDKGQKRKGPLDKMVDAVKGRGKGNADDGDDGEADNADDGNADEQARVVDEGGNAQGDNNSQA